MVSIAVFDNNNIPTVGDCSAFVALVILHYKKRV